MGQYDGFDDVAEVPDDVLEEFDRERKAFEEAAELDRTGVFQRDDSRYEGFEDFPEEVSEEAEVALSDEAQMRQLASAPGQTPVHPTGDEND